eukprot:jgi/Mesvir1/14771/Mv05412-RA.1
MAAALPVITSSVTTRLNASPAPVLSAAHIRRCLLEPVVAHTAIARHFQTQSALLQVVGLQLGEILKSPPHTLSLDRHGRATPRSSSRHASSRSPVSAKALPGDGLPGSGSDSPNSRPRGLLSKLLGGAVGIFIRSAVEGVDELNVNVQGSDDELRGGVIPGLAVSSRGASYKGIAISTAKLAAADISIDIGGIPTGRILRKPFLVLADVAFNESDLATSLQSDLVAAPLSELLTNALGGRGVGTPNGVATGDGAATTLPYRVRDVSLRGGKVLLSVTSGPPAEGDAASGGADAWPGTQQEGVDLQVCLTLELANDPTPLSGRRRGNTAGQQRLILGCDMLTGSNASRLKTSEFPLGDMNHISRLSVEQGQLVVSGQFQVIP